MPKTTPADIAPSKLLAALEEDHADSVARGLTDRAQAAEKRIAALRGPKVNTADSTPRQTRKG